MNVNEIKPVELSESKHETHAAIAIAVALVAQLGALTGVPFYSVLTAIVALVTVAIVARMYMKKKKLENGHPVSSEPIINIDNIVKDVTSAIIEEINKNQKVGPAVVGKIKDTQSQNK